MGIKAEKLLLCNELIGGSGAFCESFPNHQSIFVGVDQEHTFEFQAPVGLNRTVLELFLHSRLDQERAEDAALAIRFA